jgi:hypothetical protein
LFIATATLFACTSLEDGAKQTFSKQFTCPPDRVESRARPDLKPSAFKKAKTPPPDVAADPGRLKMWNDQQEKALTASDGMDWIAEARGCGQQAFYSCTRPAKKQNQMMCFHETWVPPTISKWDPK